MKDETQVEAGPSRELHILMLEDSPHDAELEIATLEAAGYACRWERVMTREDFLERLAEPDYDMVFADYALPSFDGISALRLFREHNLDIPFILVSGTAGEEIATESLRAGATDYVLKANLSRLAPVVTRALQERAEQRQRRQIEMALRASEARFAAIIDSAMDAIISVNERQEIVLFNSAAEEMFRCRAADAMGKPLDMFIPERYRGAHRQHIRQFGGTNVTRRSMGGPGTVFGRRADGEEFPLEASISQVETGGEKLYTVILRDTTERTRAEEEHRRLLAQLRAERERLEAVLKQMPAGVIIIEAPSGRVLLSNEQAEQIFGRQPLPETIDASAEAITRLHADGAPYRRDEIPMARALKEGEVISGEDVVVVRPDGSQRYTRVIAAPIRNRDGEVVAAVGIYQDTTDARQAEAERRHLEEQLLQSQKMESIGRLAGGIAHDFNNLLTAIIGYSQLLIDRSGADEGQNKEAREILKAGQRAASLTSQLLAFSRRQRLERRPVNLNDTINNLIKLLRRIIGEDVEVDVRTANRLPTVFADPTQIEQVLLNLAVNARDAMPGGGRLVIETRDVELDENYCREHLWARPGRYVQIAVSDTGHGMDAETLQRVFEPFFTTKEQGKGTGLGLAVVYGIVKQHDGLIYVYSQPAHGTTFRIYLPMHEKPAEELDAVQEQPLVGGDETILVAEDEETLQRLMINILSGLGYRVLVARNGEEAMQLYRENRREIDLVILDMIMPQVSGLAVYEWIRAQGARTPILFMTGYAAEMAQSRIIRELGAPILQKPYTAAELGRKVRDLLDQRKG